MNKLSVLCRCLAISCLFSSMATAVTGESMARALRVKSWLSAVDAERLTSDFEILGEVLAPIDHSIPRGPHLSVVYRRLPVLQMREDQAVYHLPTSPYSHTKPLLFFINGGPGASSNHVRPYDFRYESSIPQTDRIWHLAKFFRIVLVDQRGTDGLSSALDFDNITIEAQTIVDLFGPRAVALDYALVIQNLVKPRERFFMMGQSYGGLVAMAYMAEAEKNPELPRPAAVALTSPGIQTPEESFQRQIERRKKHRELALELKAKVPEIVDLMTALRHRLHEIDPTAILHDSLALQMGKGTDWKAEFTQTVKSLVRMDPALLLKEIKDDKHGFSFFNHILSSAIITPGFTDRTLYPEIQKLVPLEEWMPDELRGFHNTHATTPWQEGFLLEMDQRPPKLSRPLSNKEMRQAVSHQPVFLTASVDDPFIPAEAVARLFQEVSGPKTKYIEFKSGGHSAVFVPDNCDRLLRAGFQ